MQMRTAIALGALLTLAACGDDQTAKAPDNANTNTAQTTTTDSAGTTSPAAPTTTAPSTSTAAAPAGSAGTSSTATSNSAAPAGATASNGAASTATNSAGTSAATRTSVPAGDTPIDTADDLKGRNFSAGRLSLQFPDSERFVMTDTQTNDKIEGKYNVDNGALVLSEPTGDAASGTFPMRCDIQSTAADSFKLVDSDGSCAKLKDQSFKTAGG